MDFNALRIFIAEYHRQYPQVEITLKTGTTAELRQMVLDYMLDGAFVGGAVEHTAIEQEQIFEEEMVLLSQEGGSGLDDPKVRALLGFRQGCSYQDRLEDWLKRLGRPPLRIMEFGTLEAILGCVSAGMGVALMPKSVIECDRYGNSLAVHPVPKPFSKIPTMFIRRRDMKPSAALNPLLKLVSEKR